MENLVNFKKYNTPRGRYNEVNNNMLRILCRDKVVAKQGNYYIAIPKDIIGDNNHVKFGNLNDGTICFVMQKEKDEFSLQIKPLQKNSNYRLVYCKELAKEICIFFRKNPTSFNGTIEIEQVFGMNALKKINEK